MSVSKSKKHRSSSRRRDDDDDSSKESRKRKKSDHHKKSSKKRKKDKKDKKQRSAGGDYGPATGIIPNRLLDSSKDYFLYNKQLCLYLDTKGLVFDQLSGADARKAFADFCKLYNKGKLAAIYYEETNSAVSAPRTTSHTWSFQTSVIENERLREVQRTVAGGGGNPSRTTTQQQQEQRILPPLPAATSSKTAPHSQHKSAPRRRRQDYETVAEEFGLASTRDMPSAQVRRKEAAARTHNTTAADAAAVELTDDSLYGEPGRASFQAAVAAQKQRAQKRTEQKQARVASLQEQERKRQENMLEVLGLSGKIKAGEKIQIAPRNDGNA